MTSVLGKTITLGLNWRRPEGLSLNDVPNALKGHTVPPSR